MEDQNQIVDHFGDEAFNYFNEADGKAQGGKAITVPGEYAVRVDTNKFVIKKKDGTETVIETPVLTYSKDAKNLMVQINLVTVEDTPNTPAGSYTILNMMLAPSATTAATPKLMEGFKKALNISKNRIEMLVGKKVEVMDKKWVLEHLVALFDKENKCTRPHKMNEIVAIRLEGDFYNDKPTVKLMRMYPVPKGFVSTEIPMVNTYVPPAGLPTEDQLLGMITSGPRPGESGEEIAPEDRYET